jgi:hypothetical protein
MSLFTFSSDLSVSIGNEMAFLHSTSDFDGCHFPMKQPDPPGCTIFLSCTSPDTRPVVEDLSPPVAHLLETAPLPVDAAPLVGSRGPGLLFSPCYGVIESPLLDPTLLPPWYSFTHSRAGEGGITLPYGPSSASSWLIGESVVCGTPDFRFGRQ